MALRLRRVPSAQWKRLIAARSRFEPAGPPRTQITAIELSLVALEARERDAAIGERPESVATP